MEVRRGVLKLILVFSLSLNLFFAYYEIKRKQQYNSAAESLKYLGVNKNSKFKEEFTDLIKTEFNKSRANYLIISTWANFCAPCIKEMPWIDSVCGTFNKAKFKVVFASDISKPKTNNKLSLHHWNNSTFIELNHEQISALHNLVGLNIKTYPINLIVDSNLDVHFLKGELVYKDSSFMKTLIYLNTLSK